MEKNTQTNQPAQESSEVRYQFDTTLGQATIDGNLMPVMLFALRRGNRGAWLYGRIAIIVIALALCLLRIQLLTMIALLIVASSLWPPASAEGLHPLCQAAGEGSPPTGEPGPRFFQRRRILRMGSRPAAQAAVLPLKQTLCGRVGGAVFHHR